MENIEIGMALHKLRQSIPPNSNTRNLLEAYVDLLPDQPKKVTITDKQTTIIRNIALELHDRYHAVRRHIEDTESVIVMFGMYHRRVNQLATLVPDDHPDRSAILETLEDYRPEDFDEQLDEWQAFQSEITAFADKTFGGAGDPVPPLHHLRQEVDELIAAPFDALEYADAFILLIQAARRAKLTMPQLLSAAKRKHLINTKRQITRPPGQHNPTP